MDLQEYNKNVQLKLKADAIRKSFLEEKRDIENTKRGYVKQLENQYRPLIEAQKEQLNKFIDGNSEIMDVLAKQITNISQKPAIEGAERRDSVDGDLFYGVDLNSGIDPAVIKKFGYPL